MPVDIHSEEGKIIRQLIPLSTISANQFESLCTKITVEVAEASTFLFKTSDSETDLIYLIDGSITLQSNELKIETIQSGTKSSRFALAHQIPRKIDALTNTSVRFLRLNTGVIDTLPRNSFEEEENNYMVIDEPEDENDDDWMTTLLKSPIFRALPPANLQKIIMGLEEISFEKGELIIKQGDPGDFYYLIKKGHCLISRKPSANAKEIKLAQMRTQDTFGEDSIISDEPRNVSVTALTDISLLRLSRDKFISLIKEPSINYISHSEIAAKLESGAILLDVRTPDEYKKRHLTNSLNEPFFSLRMQIKTFDRRNDILVICANGKTSEAATFLLLRHKLTAFVVEGGMEQAPQEAIYSSTNNDSIDLEETPAPTSVDPVVEAPPKPVEAPSKQVEAPPKPVEAPSKQVEAPPKQVEAPPKQVEAPPKQVEAPPKQVEAPPKQVEPPPATTKIPAHEKSSQDTLQQENQELKLMLKKLTEEKEDLEKKYRILFKQSEKLKAVLDTFQIGGGEGK